MITHIPHPAAITAQTLDRPIKPATVEGSPKTPLPMIEFTTSATRLHRPMARSRFGLGPAAVGEGMGVCITDCSAQAYNAGQIQSGLSAVSLLNFSLGAENDGRATMRFHKLAEQLPSTRERALRLGLVTLEQMVMALLAAVENPATETKIMAVPEIRSVTA
jgi:hypothetical protein